MLLTPRQVSDCIGYRIEIVCQIGTLSTILQHFTHTMKQRPTAARRWLFALRDVSCRQSCHLSRYIWYPNSWKLREVTKSQKIWKLDDDDQTNSLFFGHCLVHSSHCYALPACRGALAQLSHSTQFLLQYRAVTERNQTTRFISKTISSNRSVSKINTKISLLLWQVFVYAKKIEIKWVLCESSFSDHPLKKIYNRKNSW